MEKITHAMRNNERAEQIFIINFVFWSTLLFVRGTVFLFDPSNSYPVFNIENTLVSYSLFGIILVIIALIGLFMRRTISFITLFAAGVGLAVVFDQAEVFMHGNIIGANYWSLFNLAAILVSGSLLFMFYKVLPKSGHMDPEYDGVSHVNPKNPKITVVIPAYNEEKFIGRVLKSLSNQTYKDFELLVVDNNSKDKTGEVAKSYGARVVVENKPGVANARQAGFLAANGDIIATTDSDSVVPTYWVEKILREYEANKKLVGYGGLGYLYSGPVTARASGRYFFTLFWIVDKIMSGGWNMVGFNMSARRDAFVKIGGFRTDLIMGEDIDLSQKLRKEGEVKIDTRFNIFVSGRRYKDGLFAGTMVYFPSWFMRVVFRQEKFLHFPAVRSEVINSSKLSYLPHILAVSLLIFMFYSRLL